MKSWTRASLRRPKRRSTAASADNLLCSILYSDGVNCVDDRLQLFEAYIVQHGQARRETEQIFELVNVEPQDKIVKLGFGPRRKAVGCLAPRSVRHFVTPGERPLRSLCAKVQACKVPDQWLTPRCRDLRDGLSVLVVVRCVALEQHSCARRSPSHRWRLLRRFRGLAMRPCGRNRYVESRLTRFEGEEW